MQVTRRFVCDEKRSNVLTDTFTHLEGKSPYVETSTRKYLLDWNLNAPEDLKAYFLRRRWFRGSDDPFRSIDDLQRPVPVYVSRVVEISGCNFIGPYHEILEYDVISLFRRFVTIRNL